MPDPPRILFLRRALRKRCPQCGRGPLFERYAKLLATCPECALVYRREQGGMTGTMYLTAVATELFALVLIAAIWLGTSWGVATSLAVAIPLHFAFAFWVLPYTIGAWVAIEYATDVSNGEAWARPRE